MRGPSARRSSGSRSPMTLRRVDGADVELLAPRERHELLDELGAALAGVARCFELLEYARSLAHLLADQIEIADEHGQQIVEVVSDSGRQAAERLHARAVLRRGAQRLAVVAVDEQTDEFAASGTLALHEHVAAKELRRAVEPAQLDLDDAARARSVAPCSHAAARPVLDEPLARRRLQHRRGRGSGACARSRRRSLPSADTTIAATTLLASRIARSRSAPPLAASLRLVGCGISSVSGNTWALAQADSVSTG